MEEKQLTSHRSTQDASTSTHQVDRPQRKRPPSDASHGQDEAVVQELLDIIRKLTVEKPPQSMLKHPMTLLLAGFIFSGLVGGGLTNYYTSKAQEVAATRSFSDELNKIRIQKVGEVWERLDQDEVTIANLVNELTDNASDKAARNDALQQIVKLVDTDKSVIAQHRFWIGQETHDKMRQYLDATIFLITRQILEPEATDIATLKQRRDNAKFDVEKERARFLHLTP
jgi:hypothetical protein